MTLHLYIAKRFFWRFLAFFTSFFALSVLTDATSLLGIFQNAHVGIGETLRLALLKAPSDVYRLLPFIMVLASLSLLLGLSRTSELVATRAAGQSGLKILFAPVVTAFFIGVIGLGVYNPFAAAALNKFESDTGRYKSGVLSSFSLSRKGIWLRQGGANGQTVIFAKRANFDATRLIGVTFFELTKEGAASRRIETSFSRLTKGAWELGPGKYWMINTPGKVPDQTAVAFTSLSLPSDLTSSQILDSFGDPTTISIWDTQNFIAKLEKSGFSTIKHRVHFQTQLATPLMLIGMVLLGAGLSMRHNRATGRGIMILFTVLMGLTAYILQDFAEILGANGAIPAIAAAWAPPISVVLFATGLLLHMEDG